MKKHYSQKTQKYAGWLFALSGLFLFRIISQLMVAITDITFLPSFESWHSGTMPYSLLLTFQVIILVVMLRTAFMVLNGKTQPNGKLGKILLAFGAVYFVSMLLRLALGLTLYTESRWFTNTIATFFHIILASYVLVVSHFHLRYVAKELS